MTIAELWASISSLNWEIFVTIVVANWYFYRRIKKDVEAVHQKMSLLDERMFLLATGKSLAEAIKDERLKEKAVNI